MVLRCRYCGVEVPVLWCCGGFTVVLRYRYCGVEESVLWC